MLGYFNSLSGVESVPKQSTPKAIYINSVSVHYFLSTPQSREGVHYVLCEVLRAARRYTTTDSVYTIAPATVFAVVYYRVKQ